MFSGISQKFGHVVDLPLEPDDKVDLGLSSDVKVTGLPGLSLQSDLLLLLSSVLSNVFIGSLEDDLPLLLLLLLC